MSKQRKKQVQKKYNTALVTGGAGFIGSNLVDNLIKKNWQVIILDNLLTGKKENLNPKAEFHKIDIRDLESIRPYFKKVDYVFHLAAFPRVQPSIEDPITTHNINVNGTLNVLKAATEAYVKKFVFSSSSSVYGNQEKMPLREDMPASPLSPYALHKYLGEQYCKLFSKIYGLPTVCLRYFNVYGKRQATEGAYVLVTAIFIRQRLNNQPLTITDDGEQRRDFTSVKDVVRANILAAESEKVGKGEIINIGRGSNLSVNQIAKMIGGPITHVPHRLEPRQTLADNLHAKKLLSWVPKENIEDWIVGYKKELKLK